MIKSIELTNWKSHQHSVLEFEKGTNVLIGVAGAGKSSVMDAICYALYGTFPSLNSKKVSISEVLMNKPIKAEEGKLKLCFEYNEKEYEIERTIYLKGVNQANLRESGRIIAGPKPKEVNEKIIDLIKVDFDLFSRAIYSEQNNLDYFLRMTPMQRKQKFDELLQINKYEEARSNCLTAVNRLKKTNEERMKLIESQKKAFNEKELSMLEEKIKEKEKLINEIEKNSVELKEKEKTLKEKMQKNELKEKEFKELNNAVNLIKGKTDSAEKELMKAKKEVNEKNIDKIKEEMNELIKVLELIPLKKKEIEKKLNEKEEKYSMNLKECSGIEAKEKQLQESKNKLQEIGAECPLCRKPMEMHSKQELMQEIEKEAVKLKQEFELKEKELKKISEEKKELKKEIELISEKEKKLIEEKYELQEKISSFKLMQEKEKEVKELEEKKKELMNALKKTEFNEKEFNELKQEFYSLKEKINSKEKEISGEKELIQEMNKRINEMNEFRKSFTELELKAVHSKEMQEKLSVFMNSLKQTQNELRVVLIDSINSAMESIWPQVYPYKDFSSAKIIVNEGEYEVMVKNKENEFIRVEGILSGGERTAAAITLRIAFSLVLTQNLGWIILDEPTHNLDERSVKELAVMLKKHLPEIVEQVFVITHDNEMKNAATGKLYLLERKKEEFESTNIIETNLF
ncbi:MAG: AAA family ATPase [Candidatus Diapherotrites archaeon]|nr:AAA family ATPase [Candidatus Diapherotrites archaeon]